MVQIQPAEIHDIQEAEINPPNLNAHTVVQGVPFHAGFHPSDTVLADSPMQAYNENVSDTDSHIMIQIVFVHDSFYAANATALNSLAKSTLHSYCMPQLKFDNAYFFAPTVKFDASALFELFGEKFIFHQNKKRVGKALLLHPFSADSLDVTEETRRALIPSVMDTEMTDYALLNDSAVVTLAIGQNRKKSSAQTADPPSCTTQVRRSFRCNKYDGFKPKNISDTKIAESKVKPRKVTSTLNICHTEESSDAVILAQGNPPPAHTPIPVMQSIGINLCGVPPEDLSPKKLMASVQETDEEEEDKA
jgi:hypothetical protein